MQQHSLPPRAVPATGFRRPPLAHALPVLTAPALRHLCRAHAACIAAPHAPCRCVALSLCCGCENNCGGTPRARASAAAASTWLRAGQLFELTPALKGAAKVRAVLASSPQAVFRALRAAHLYNPLLRLPMGGTPQGTLSAQQSADRSTRPAAGLPPPRAGLPAPLTPPWGSTTSRRCALCSLLSPHPPQMGTRCAAGYARCTDSFDVSGQAEGSIVTPQNLSRARLATLGGYATLDRTCCAPAAA